MQETKFSAAGIKYVITTVEGAEIVQILPVFGKHNEVQLNDTIDELNKIGYSVFAVSASDEDYTLDQPDKGKEVLDQFIVGEPMPYVLPDTGYAQTFDLMFDDVLVICSTVEPERKSIIKDFMGPLSYGARVISNIPFLFIKSPNDRIFAVVGFNFYLYNPLRRKEILRYSSLSVKLFLVECGNQVILAKREFQLNEKVFSIISKGLKACEVHHESYDHASDVVDKILLNYSNKDMSARVTFHDLK